MINVNLLQEIIAAAKKGQAELNLLVQKKIDLNQVFFNDSKLTALIWAICNESKDVVGALLKAGADPNQFGHGSYPIHFAAQYNCVEKAILLLEHGAKKTMTEWIKNENALSIALKRGDGHLAEALIQAGALLSIEKLFDFLCMAVKYDWNKNAKNIINLMSKEYPEEIYSFSKMLRWHFDNPMMIAVERKNIELVKHFVSSKVFIYRLKDNSRNYLHGAVDLKSFQNIEKMRKRGLEVVKILINHGGRDMINYKDERGVTPLYMALSQNSGEIAKMLLQEGAEPIDIPLNAKEIKLMKEEQGIAFMFIPNKPLLYCAIESNDAEILQLMFHKGLKYKEVKPYQSRTPLTYAIDQASKTVDRNPAIQNTRITQTIQIIRILHQQGADLNEYDMYGQCAMALSISLKLNEVALALLEMGAGISLAMMKKAIHAGNEINLILYDIYMSLIYILLEKSSGSFSNQISSNDAPAINTMPHDAVLNDEDMLRDFMPIVPATMKDMLKKSFQHRRFLIVCLELSRIFSFGHCQVVANIIEHRYITTTGDHLLESERDLLINIMIEETRNAAMKFFQCFPEQITAIIQKAALETRQNDDRPPYGQLELNESFIFEILERYIAISLRFNHLKQRQAEQFFKPYIEALLYENNMLQTPALVSEGYLKIFGESSKSKPENSTNNNYINPLPIDLNICIVDYFLGQLRSEEQSQKQKLKGFDKDPKSPYCEKAVLIKENALITLHYRKAVELSKTWFDEQDRIRGIQSPTKQPQNPTKNFIVTFSISKNPEDNKKPDGNATSKACCIL